LSKKLKDGKIEWKLVVDEIEEEQVQAAFIKVDDALNKIKNKQFDKNEKSCYSFGRRCEFWGLCKQGKTQGLIKR
jgi:hypothetical protein